MSNNQTQFEFVYEDDGDATGSNGEIRIWSYPIFTMVDYVGPEIMSELHEAFGNSRILGLDEHVIDVPTFATINWTNFSTKLQAIVDAVMSNAGHPLEEGYVMFRS